MKEAPRYRSVAEQASYFLELANHFEKLASREKNQLARERYDAKCEAYSIAAFELKENVAQPA